MTMPPSVDPGDHLAVQAAVLDAFRRVAHADAIWPSTRLDELDLEPHAFDEVLAAIQQDLHVSLSRDVLAADTLEHVVERADLELAA